MDNENHDGVLGNALAGSKKQTFYCRYFAKMLNREPLFHTELEDAKGRYPDRHAQSSL